MMMMMMSSMIKMEVTLIAAGTLVTHVHYLHACMCGSRRWERGLLHVVLAQLWALWQCSCLAVFSPAMDDCCSVHGSSYLQSQHEGPALMFAV